MKTLVSWWERFLGLFRKPLIVFDPSLNEDVLMKMSTCTNDMILYRLIDIEKNVRVINLKLEELSKLTKDNQEMVLYTASTVEELCFALSGDNEDGGDDPACVCEECVSENNNSLNKKNLN